MILLVDDNCESSEALAEFLSREGHAVQRASNGSEALRLLADSQTRPALIFLDLEMPVLDGWGFLAERSKDPILADVPAVHLAAIRQLFDYLVAPARALSAGTLSGDSRVRRDAADAQAR